MGWPRAVVVAILFVLIPTAALLAENLSSQRLPDVKASSIAQTAQPLALSAQLLVYTDSQAVTLPGDPSTCSRFYQPGASLQACPWLWFREDYDVVKSFLAQHLKHLRWSRYCVKCLSDQDVAPTCRKF